jgi:hypothetical protein
MHLPDPDFPMTEVLEPTLTTALPVIWPTQCKQNYVDSRTQDKHIPDMRTIFLASPVTAAVSWASVVTVV